MNVPLYACARPACITVVWTYATKSRPISNGAKEAIYPKLLKRQNETSSTMKEMLTFKGCYSRDNNADNDDNDVDDDCHEGKRRLYLAYPANIG